MASAAARAGAVAASAEAAAAEEAAAEASVVVPAASQVDGAFTAVIRRAVVAALMPSPDAASAGIGLPILPLIDIISQYAAFQSKDRPCS